jgi:hypothetical protein
METSHITDDIKQPTQSENADFPIQWEDDPENPNLLRINLPRFIASRCKDQPLTPKQSDFLNKFQQISLPIVLNSDDQETLASLKCSYLFKITQLENGYEISHAALPQKVKRGCMPYDKTSREQLKRTIK